MRGLCLLAENLLASQEGICSMELVMERSDHGLIWCTTLTFAWRYRKTMKDLHPDSQFLVQDLNLGPPYTKQK